MGHDAIKLELIEWLAKLEDDETIQYLKVVKDSKSNEQVKKSCIKQTNIDLLPNKQ